MDYKIVVTKDAEEDLDRFIQYLIFEKKSMQAADLSMQKQQKLDANDMTQIIMGMLGSVDLDEFEIQKFQELTLHMLQRKR